MFSKFGSWYYSIFFCYFSPSNFPHLRKSVLVTYTVGSVVRAEESRYVGKTRFCHVGEETSRCQIMPANHCFPAAVFCISSHACSHFSESRVQMYIGTRDRWEGTGRWQERLANVRIDGWCPSCFHHFRAVCFPSLLLLGHSRKRAVFTCFLLDTFFWLYVFFLNRPVLSV